MLTVRQQRFKRFFDLSFSILLLPFVIFPLILLLLLAQISTGKSGLFIQQRIGCRGKQFSLYKIRSLKGENHKDAVAVKSHQTSLGRWLRKTKLDELPQLFNIVKGDMSWVGPRPDVPGYTDKLEGEDRIILEVKPGITGPASIKYKDEEAVLLKQQNPLAYNDNVIWPDKVKINIAYIKQWSFWKDMGFLFTSLSKK